ncbi:MAG TPA: DUF4976 domain-containing protein, partial [Chitinophagaceae bacterium]|nr:DUF4976 domain-containing protein [Chitinophagaceae bacterium]
FMQGISLVPLIKGQTKNLSRKNLYYHYYEDKADHTVLQHLGIRTEKYKLIYFYTVEEWELYNLENDPDEQKNLISKPEYQSLIKKLKNQLLELRNKYEDHEKAGQLN